MSNTHYNEEIKRAIHIAQAIAKEYSNEQFSPAHLLRAMLHKDLALRNLLQSAGKDVYFMEDWADVRIEAYPKKSKVDEAKADDKIKAVFDEAENVRIKLSRDEIDLQCLLGAICTPGIAFSYDQLKTFPVTVAEIISGSFEENNVDHPVGKELPAAPFSASKTGAIANYCIDKTASARSKKLHAITGRDSEIRMIAEILGRFSKPNVIITGDPGVGKTALVNGFVLDIMDGKLAQNLKNAVVFELDTSAFIAGASYKGEVEDRMKNIIKELQQFDKAILFIDNIHILLDKNGATPGLANMLKSELSKSGLTIIGATTIDNYRKHIETDETFNRLFEIVHIEEPDETMATRMLNIIIPHFEQHHNIQLSEGVVAESVRLSKRYLKERSLPDSAIDLIDRTMSAVKMTGDTSKTGIEAVKAELKLLLEKRESIAESEFIAELQWLSRLLKSKVSPVLYNQVEDEGKADALDSSEDLQQKLHNLLDKLLSASSSPKNKIESSDIAAIVSAKTGIPMGKLHSKEKDKLMKMEELIKKRVVGQDHAIKSVTEAVLESRSGLSKPGQPIGSFFLLGPTGTGKTELAKSLAELLFDNENSLIRFDMSEFKEEHSAALLYGAPPGYVGYEEGGMLVNKIRQKPYSIVLFDEIEKAHPSVFDLFLQIMDEGKLHDRLGKEGDFSNAVILFTSNIGSDFIIESFNKNVIPASSDLMEIMSKHFRPEFLARLTEIVPFSPITKKIVLNIFSIHLAHLLKILDRQGITLSVTDKAKERLAMSGFTPRYGARPIQGVIRNQVRRPLSRMIITGQLQKGDSICLDINEAGNLSWLMQEADELIETQH
jgi:ATP-dependent Clp protease ATP-binding subunit ClpB